MSNISTGETVTVGELREWLDGYDDDVKVYANIFDRGPLARIVNQSNGFYRKHWQHGGVREPLFIDLGVSPEPEAKE